MNPGTIHAVGQVSPPNGDPYPLPPATGSRNPARLPTEFKVMIAGGRVIGARQRQISQPHCQRSPKQRSGCAKTVGRSKNGLLPRPGSVKATSAAADIPIYLAA